MNILGITDSEQCEKLADLLTKYLHGSGFDGDWKVSMQPSGNYFVSIGYHAMDTNGYYDGWFTVKASVNVATMDYNGMNFTASSSLRRKYITGQRDYFEGSLNDAMLSIRQELEFYLECQDFNDDYDFVENSQDIASICEYIAGSVKAFNHTYGEPGCMFVKLCDGEYAEVYTCKREYPCVDEEVRRVL